MKSAVDALLLSAALLATPSLAAEPCCKTCPDGKVHFYSIPNPKEANPQCGECCLDPKLYNFWKLFEPKLLEGTCSSQGYTKYASTETDGVWPLAVTNDRYTHDNASDIQVSDTCSLYAISGDTCGQSDLDCKYAPYAKKAESKLKDGTCASQGYTVKGKVTTKKYPFIGDITITEYTKPSEMQVADTCSLYAISGDTCGQSDLDCKYAPYAKKFESKLKDGTCASQGYTVKGKVTTKKVPVIGDITITEYTKPSEMQVADTCSLYAISGDTCGQSDLDCKYAPYAKKAESKLKDGTCASQGYTVKGDSETKKYPVVGDITITKYTKPAALSIVV